MDSTTTSNLSLPPSLKDVETFLQNSDTKKYIKDIRFFLDIPQYSIAQLRQETGLKDHEKTYFTNRNTVPLLNRIDTNSLMEDSTTIIANFKYTTEEVDTMKTVHLGINLYNMYEQIKIKAQNKIISDEIWEDDVKDLQLHISSRPKLYLLFIKEPGSSISIVTDCLPYIIENMKDTEAFVMRVEDGVIRTAETQKPALKRKKNNSIIMIVDEEGKPIGLTVVNNHLIHSIAYGSELAVLTQKAQDHLEHFIHRKSDADDVDEDDEDESLLQNTIGRSSANTSIQFVVFHDLISMLETSGTTSKFLQSSHTIAANDPTGMMLYNRIRVLINHNKIGFSNSWQPFSNDFEKFEKFRKCGQHYTISVQIRGGWKIINVDALEHKQIIQILGQALEDDKDWVRALVEEAAQDKLISAEDFMAATSDTDLVVDPQHVFQFKKETMTALKELFAPIEDSSFIPSRMDITSIWKDKVAIRKKKNSEIIKKFQSTKKMNEDLLKRCETLAKLEVKARKDLKMVENRCNEKIKLIQEAADERLNEIFNADEMVDCIFQED